VNSSTKSGDLAQTLLEETGLILWQELQRFYAQGKILLVDKSLDFQQVALTLAQDQAEQVEEWLTQGVLGKPDDEQAKEWYENKKEFRALVVAPWVLIQDL